MNFNYILGDSGIIKHIVITISLSIYIVALLIIMLIFVLHL